MAKFNEILSGIAKDFVQLQVASDLASIEAFNQYQNTTNKNEENLKFLDVPRFTVSDVKMNLKFAIAEVATENVFTKDVIDKTNDNWKSVVENQVIANVLKGVRTLTPTDKKKILADVKKANSFTKKNRPGINSIIMDSKELALENTTNYVLSYLKQLPPTISKKIKVDTSFKSLVNRQVNAVYTKELGNLRKQAEAESVVQKNLEIIINKDDLEKIDNSQVHEISFNLTPDFIKLVKEDDT